MRERCPRPLASKSSARGIFRCIPRTASALNQPDCFLPAGWSSKSRYGCAPVASRCSEGGGQPDEAEHRRQERGEVEGLRAHQGGVLPARERLGRAVLRGHRHDLEPGTGLVVVGQEDPVTRPDGVQVAVDLAPALEQGTAHDAIVMGEAQGLLLRRPFGGRPVDPVDRLVEEVAEGRAGPCALHLGGEHRHHVRGRSDRAPGAASPPARAPWPRPTRPGGAWRSPSGRTRSRRGPASGASAPGDRRAAGTTRPAASGVDGRSGGPVRRREGMP